MDPSIKKDSRAPEMHFHKGTSWVVSCDASLANDKEATSMQIAARHSRLSEIKKCRIEKLLGKSIEADYHGDQSSVKTAFTFGVPSQEKTFVER